MKFCLRSLLLLPSLASIFEHCASDALSSFIDGYLATFNFDVTIDWFLSQIIVILICFMAFVVLFMFRKGTDSAFWPHR